jgi:hypothetical protein
MLSPIQEFNISLTRPHTLENDETRTPLCQGLPFAISTPEFRFSYGAEVEMKQTVLSDYLSDFSRISAGKLSVASPSLRDFTQSEFPRQPFDDVLSRSADPNGSKLPSRRAKKRPDFSF